MSRRALPLAFCACALLALALSAAAAGGGGGDGGPIVRVQQGQLRGRRVEQPEAQLRMYYAFEGVPYARPPVGALRFKDPALPQPWSGVRNATAPGPICYQKILDTHEIFGEENCLFLNVYSADPPEAWPTARRGVMLLLHGGAFIMSSGNLGTMRADPILRRGVVLVTINYRLGVMGFLNTEDSAAPGNAGLKDQVMALRWVQSNIAAFGGDASNVTIFGTSAGGASVQYLAMSPVTSGLFRRALAMSGSVFDPWAFIEGPRRYAKALRQRFTQRCPDVAPDDIVRCLQSVAARDLVDSEDQVPPPEFRYRFWKHTFLPAVEAPRSSRSPLLPSAPEELLRQGHFAKVPFMTGFLTAEGILDLFYYGMYNDSSGWRTMDEHFVDMLRPEMPRGLRTNEAVLRMRQFYFGNSSIADGLTNADTMNKFVQMISDVRFVVGVVRGAHLMASGGVPLFMYQFSHDGPFTFWKTALDIPQVRGVGHGDDLAYLLEIPQGNSTTPPQAPPEEVAIRERQAALYTNFAKTGNPTPEGSGLLRWPRYTPQRESYMDMGANLTVHDHVLGERMVFWRQLANASEVREGYSPAPPQQQQQQQQ